MSASFNSSVPQRNRGNYLYVKNIPKTLTQENLVKLFSKFGDVKNVTVKDFHDSPYAFVNFQSSEEAYIAFSRIQSEMANMFGMVIRLGKEKEKSLPQKSSNPPCTENLHVIVSDDNKRQVSEVGKYSVNHNGHSNEQINAEERAINVHIPVHSNVDNSSAISQIKENARSDSFPPFAEDNRNTTLSHHLNVLTNTHYPMSANNTYFAPPPPPSVLPCCNLHPNFYTPYNYYPRCSSGCHHNTDQFHNPDPNIPLLRPTFSICAYCRREGKFLCNDCDEPYCSRQCQESHWPEHKIVCNLRQLSVSSIEKERSVVEDNASSHVVQNRIASNDLKHGSTTSAQSKNINDNSTAKGKEPLKSQTNENSYQNKEFTGAPRDHQYKSGRNKFSDNRKQTDVPHPNNKYPKKQNSSSDYKSQREFESNKISSKCNGNEQLNKRRFFHRKKTLDYDPKSTSEETENWDVLCQKDAPKVVSPVKKTLDYGSKSTSEENENWNVSSQKETPKVVSPVKKNKLLVPEKIKVSALKQTELKDNEKVTVCYVKSVNRFYVNREVDMDTLKTINLQMNESTSKIVVETPEINDICGALFALDNNYYRAQIVRIFDDDTCGVSFIDYGNVAKVKKLNLCHLSTNLNTYPAMAVRCQLGEIQPVGGTEEWSTEANNFFQEMVNENPCFVINIINKHGSCYAVRLSNNSTNVGNALIKKNLAKSSLNVEDKSQVSSHLSTKSDTNVKSPFGEKSLNNSNLKTQDKQLIRVSSEESDGDIDIPSVFGKLKENSSYDILVTHVEKDWLFVQLIIEGIYDKFTEMSQELQAVNTKDVTMSIEEGEFAKALCLEDQVWYRCIILNRMKNSFRVQYIDFGNQEDVKSLQELSPEQMNVDSPLLCIKFSSQSELQIFINFPDIYKTLSQIVIKNINNESADIELKFENQNFRAKVFPWSSTLSLKKTANFELPSVKFVPALPKIHMAPKKEILQTKIDEFDNGIVRIKHIDSFRNLYVRLISHEDKFQSMLKDLSAFCKKENVLNYNPELNDVICLNWQNQCVRGFISKLQNESCNVKLIDHGPILENILVADLVPLPSEYLHPVFMISIKLNNVPSEKLTDEKCEELKSLDCKLSILNKDTEPYNSMIYANNSCLNEQLIMEKNDFIDISLLKNSELLNDKIYEVIFFHAENNKHYLQKMTDQEEFGQLTADLTKHCENASHLKTSPKIGQIVCAKSYDIWCRAYVKTVNSIHCDLVFFDYGNSEKISFENIYDLPSELAVLRIFGICVEVENSNCIKLYDPMTVKVTGQLGKLVVHIVSEETPALKKDVASDSICEFHINNFPRVEFPTGNLPIMILYGVSHMVVFVTPLIEENINASGNLIIEMTNFVKNQEVKPYKPVEGEVVLVKYEEDESWYRGVAIEVNETDAQILFVDFGNNQLTKFENIRKMEQQFAILPLQVETCSIGGFTCAEGKEKEVDEILLEKGFLNDKLDAIHQVIDGNHIIEIPLFTEVLKQLNLIKIE